MRKLSCGTTALHHLCLFPPPSCLCIRNTNITNNNNNNNDDDDEEKKPLIPSSSVMLKDAIAPPPTLAFQLKPKIVVMRVSMHCNGCARQVKKHISKLEGVSSYEIDLETKMVVVRGDIVPFEVLESVSKIKTAQLWND